MDKVGASGDKRAMPTMEIPGTGWFAQFTDPAGSTMALYKAMTAYYEFGRLK